MKRREAGDPAPPSTGRRAQGLLLAALAFISGLAMSMQLKNVLAAGGSVSSVRVRELNEQISALELNNSELESRIVELEDESARQRVSAEEARVACLELRSRLESLKTAAGWTALEGPGVTVTIGLKEAGSGVIRQVSDTDLLTLVNELKAAGAEAIAVNGQRVGSRTEIRSAGTYISVNGHACGAPFVVTALGDRDTLAAALNLYGGVAEMLATSFDIEIAKRSALTVPAYEGDLEFAFAQPVRD